jgi:Tol biopolymer transport system component
MRPTSVPTGALTYTFTDTGTGVKRIDDKGQDACSYLFPDGKRIVWTSTKDNLDMPIGNWSDSNDYPQGAEFYISDLDGGNAKRLTFNRGFDGFPSLSPDGRKMLFARSTGCGFMSSLYTHVMDVSSLNLGPANFKGVPGITPPKE